MLKPTLLLFIGVMMSLRAYTQQTNSVSINTTVKQQTMTDFGAAIAYFDNWVTAHPKKAELYDLIFRDLNLSILRVRNTHGYVNSSTTDMQEIVSRANTSLGRPVELLLTSWSPPATLKANGILNGGTLLKTNGQFVYNDFAQWWYDGIQAYTQAGLAPTYISMQNEPDYENTGWETCIFKNIESSSYPGYGVALETVYKKLQGLPNRPKIIGPEVTGIGNNNFPNYVTNLNKSYLDAYSYHLYNGGDANNPDSFSQALTNIKNSYSDKPNIMTEFSGGSWFSTAWLIHDCLANANASGYLYWNLIWGRPYGTGGMVSLENPWDITTWTTSNGYIINGDYYALKHFSKSISKGYVRVESSVANTNIKPTAYLSADGNKVVVVLLNISTSAETTSIALNGFPAGTINGYQSVENNYYYPLSVLAPGASMSLPARSVTTLEFTKGQPVAVTGITISPATTSISAGTTLPLTVVISPANATNKTVAWSSSNVAVATVSATGFVTGINAGSTTITALTQDGNKMASSLVTVVGVQASCTYGTPVASGLPTIQASFTKVYVVGSGGPTLGNVTNFTINWNLSLNGLWQLSFNTNNGQPSWWIDLRSVCTWKLNQAQPDITFANSGFAGLDGSYWMGMDGTNVVMVSKNRGFTLYFSNSSTQPLCNASQLRLTATAQTSETVLYPNPFTDNLTLKMGTLQDITSIQIVNPVGVIKMVDTNRLTNDELQLGEDWPSGLYIIFITDRHGTKSYRVLKK